MLLRLNPLSVQAGVHVTTLASFDGTPGYNPSGELVHSADGSFYGTTSGGGDIGAGAFFKFTITNGLSFPLSFNGTNGSGPNGIVKGSDGNFYGTTSSGGDNDFGTVFKVTPSGAQTVLFSFEGAKGKNPIGLVAGKDGSCYGVTSYGGPDFNGNPYTGEGVVFKVSAQGNFSVIYNFQPGGNAVNPSCFVQAADGNFYGTTFAGGDFGGGTVFRMTPGGKYTTLVSFDANGGPLDPYDLVQGKDGQFYGVSGFGGANNSGTFFKVTTAGAVTLLASFGGDLPGNPLSIIADKDGRFYGRTVGGIYSATPSGIVTMTVSHDLNDSGSPTPTGLIQDPDGTLYGTATGDIDGAGIIFKLSRVAYQGLFYPINDAGSSSSGSFTFSVGLDFSFVGKLQLGSQSYSMGGQFDPQTLAASVVIKRPHQTDLTVNLQVVDPGDTMTGTVSDGTWASQVSGSKLSSSYNVGNPSPFAGNYSLTFLGDSDGTYSPGYGGYGRVMVAPDGTLKLAGALADGASVSQSSVVSASGEWPLFASLYSGKGSLVGWISFTNAPTYRLAGSVIWTKTGLSGKYYPNGFTNSMRVLGSILH